MEVEMKEGAARLFSIEDVGKENVFKKPLVGWQPISQGKGIYNPRGHAMIRIIVQKAIEGRLEDLYDQPLFIENPGSVVVARAGDAVGFIQNYRLVADRLPDISSDYVLTLNEQKRWDEILGTLGKWMWELPRGLMPPDNEKDIEKFVIATAKAESLQEAGFRLQDARICGEFNFNSTFFAHSQYVVSARIVGIEENKPEELEVIGNTKLFTLKEIRQMVDSRELIDGMTLTALAIAGVHF